MNKEDTFYRDKLIKAVGLPVADRIPVETMEEAKELAKQGLEVFANPEGETDYGYYFEDISYDDPELDWAWKAKLIRNSNSIMYCVVFMAIVTLISVIIAIWSGAQVANLMNGVFR